MMPSRLAYVVEQNSSTTSLSVDLNYRTELITISFYINALKLIYAIIWKIEQEV